MTIHNSKNSYSWVTKIIFMWVEQNCWYWATQNLCEIHEKPLHSFKSHSLVCSFVIKDNWAILREEWPNDNRNIRMIFTNASNVFLATNWRRERWILVPARWLNQPHCSNFHGNLTGSISTSPDFSQWRLKLTKISGHFRFCFYEGAYLKSKVTETFKQKFTPFH